MSHTVRIFLLWLLIVALPMQGFASALNISCAAHHDASSTVSAAHEHHAQNASHSRHCDSATTQDSDSDTAKDHYAMDKNMPCSACAIYCASMVMLPATLTVNSLAASAPTLAIPVDFPFTGFIPSGLERPPRITS
jgi:hypothetical protein